MYTVSPPASSAPSRLTRGQVGCLLGIIFGSLIAITAYFLYLQNPQPSLLNIAITGLGFLLSSLAGIVFEKTLERTWALIFGGHTSKQESNQWLKPNFDDIFKTISANELQTTIALVPIPFVELRETEDVDVSLSQRIIIVGPSDVGKTRQVLELIKIIAVTKFVCVIVPKRYPIITPNFIPDHVTNQHVVLFLDDVYRIYRARDPEDWQDHLGEIISFFEHYCGERFTILATLRESDFVKAYYPQSRIWKSFNKVVFGPLSQDAEELLIHSLSDFSGIRLEPTQVSNLAKINPGTCTDLINLFLQKRIENRERISDNDVDTFRPDYWNKQVFPTLPVTTQALFRALALYRELGISPTRDLVILLASSLLVGNRSQNVRRIRKNIVNLVAQGLLLEDGNHIICHDTYLDGKARPQTDLATFVMLLRKLGHYGLQLIWERIVLGISKRTLPTPQIIIEAQYSLLQAADYLWVRQPRDAIAMLRGLANWLYTNRVAGLLIQVFMKWHKDNVTLVDKCINNLFEGKSHLSRKAALVLARNLGLVDLLSYAGRQWSSDIRNFGVEQIYHYWRVCADSGRLPELETLSRVLSSKAIIPIIVLPHPLMLLFLLDLSVRLGTKLFGTDTKALVPLLRCWQRILSTWLFIDRGTADGFTSYRKSFRLSFVVWYGAWQLRRIMANSFRKDHLVNLKIIEDWFNLPKIQRLEWAGFLPLTQPGEQQLSEIRQQLIQLAQDDRPLFGILVIPALATRLASEFFKCTEIVKEIFETNNAQAWSIGLRVLIHGVELGFREPSRVSMIYKLAKTQLLKMWLANKFREARFDMIGWGNLLEAWGGQDSERPLDFAMELAKYLPEDNSPNDVSMKIDLIRSVSNVGLDGYPKLAIATLEHWYSWDEPYVRNQLINHLACIRNIYPAEVDKLIYKLESLNGIKKTLVSQIQEYSTKEVWTKPAGSVLIALFRESIIRTEWVAALSEDMLTSNNITQALRKMLLRMLNLMITDRAINFITYTS